MKYEKPIMIDSKIHESDPEIQPMGFIVLVVILVAGAVVVAGAAVAVGAAVGGVVAAGGAPFYSSFA